MNRNLARYFPCWLIGLLCCVGFHVDTQAQQIGISTPFTSVGDSYYENLGVNFGFSFPGGRGPGSRVVGYAGNGVFTPNIGFQQGSAGATIPPFGGFDPNAGANFGFARINPGGGGFNLGFSLGKGNTRTLTSTAPSVVVPNGFGGSIFSGSFSPFVTSVTPVVGNRFDLPLDNAVTRALQSGQLDTTYSGEREESRYVRSGTVHVSESSAKYGDASVDSIKAQRLAQQRAQLNEVQSLIDRGLAHEENSEFRLARVMYRRATKLSKDKEQLKWLRDRVRYLKGR